MEESTGQVMDGGCIGDGVVVGRGVEVGGETGNAEGEVVEGEGEEGEEECCVEDG